MAQIRYFAEPRLREDRRAGQVEVAAGDGPFDRLLITELVGQHRFTGADCLRLARRINLSGSIPDGYRLRKEG